MERSGDDTAGTCTTGVNKSAGEPVSCTVSSELFGIVSDLRLASFGHHLVHRAFDIRN